MDVHLQIEGKQYFSVGSNCLTSNFTFSFNLKAKVGKYQKQCIYIISTILGCHN
jgi:hypothetical protein